MGAARMTYSLQQSTTGLTISHSSADRGYRWLTPLVGMVLTSGVTAQEQTKPNHPVIIEFRDATPYSIYTSSVTDGRSSEPLLKELERIATRIAHSNPQFDDVTLRAIYENPEDLYF
jgi:hypothetical protein